MSQKEEVKKNTKNSGKKTITQNNRKNSGKKHRTIKFYGIVLAGECIVIIGLLLFFHSLLTRVKGTTGSTKNTELLSASESAAASEDIVTMSPDPVAENISAEGGEALNAEESEAAEPDFEPYCTDGTNPSNLIQSTGISVNDVPLEDITAYVPDSEISFGLGDTYTEAEGVITFRGNNFRNSPAYGYANMKENTLNAIWSKNTGALTSKGKTWSGSGWTGQPLIMKWPKEIRTHMNMYDTAKGKEDLVEVIYACMDGYIYFLDLETGEATRDSMYLGYTFKGSGALDPRGYPVMYVGAGYDSDAGKAKVFIINLLDCSVMYTFGNADSFSLRGTLSYFDSSALVDAETDTLIYPGENGILYLIHLNTVYDENAGTLSIAPDRTVKWRYNGNRTSQSSYWLGMEDSAAIYKGYLFIADNGGNLMCLNLNTLQLVWVQDVLDDTNTTPVLSVEDGHLYLYISTSFHLGWRSSDTATIPVWKIDAQNGEIVWQTDYTCHTQKDVSGGVQSTIAPGSEDLSDYIYVTVSMTDSSYSGVLACLDKQTGSVQWEHQAGYAWSSPVCVYNTDGSSNVIYCDNKGKMYLLDGKTGEVYDSLELSQGVIEASPAAYNNYVIAGTRAGKIWGIELK